MRRLITILFLLITISGFGQYEKILNGKNVNPYNLILKNKFIWEGKEVVRDSLVYAEIQTGAIRFRYFDGSWTDYYQLNEDLSGIRDTLVWMADSITSYDLRLQVLEGFNETDPEFYLWLNNVSFQDSILTYQTDNQTLSTNGNPGVIAIENGNSIIVNVDDADASSTNEIQDISTTGAAGNISISDGSTLNLNVNDADASISNEIQSINLDANILSISNDISTVDLSGYLDNTDNQQLSIDSTNRVFTIALENGGNVKFEDRNFTGEYDDLLNRPILMDNSNEADPLFKDWNKTEGINIWSKQIFDWDEKLEPFALESDITGGVLDADFTSVSVNGSSVLTTETDPDFNSHIASSITVEDTTWWGTNYFYKDANGIRYNSNVGIGIASDTYYTLNVNGNIRSSSGLYGSQLSLSGFFLKSGEIIFDAKPNQDQSIFSYNGSVWMDSDDNKLYFTNSGGTYDLTAGGSGATYDGWLLYTDGINRGTISNNEVVNFAAGSNMSLSYNSTNNTITLNSSSTGGESLWNTDSYGINYITGNVGIGSSSINGYNLNVDKSLAGWAARFNNTNTSSHGIQIITGNTNPSYSAIQAANSQGAIFQLRNSGNLRLHNYGLGSFNGTVAKYLAVDSNGNVIESDGTSTGSGSGTVESVAVSSSDFTVSGSPITTSGTITLNLDNDAIVNQTALTSGLDSTDELMVSDAGLLKRMDVSVLQTYMQNNLSFGAGSSLWTEDANGINYQAGNIGIGTNSTSTSALTVAGNIYASGYRVRATTLDASSWLISQTGLTLSELSTTVSTPLSGTCQFYVKNDGMPYFQNDASNEYNLLQTATYSTQGRAAFDETDFYIYNGLVQDKMEWRTNGSFTASGTTQTISLIGVGSFEYYGKLSIMVVDTNSDNFSSYTAYASADMDSGTFKRTRITVEDDDTPVINISYSWVDNGTNGSLNINISGLVDGHTYEYSYKSETIRFENK